MRKSLRLSTRTIESVLTYAQLFDRIGDIFMGQNIHIANASSESVYVLVAPNPDWAIVDVVADTVVDVALQFVPVLDVLADAVEGLEIVEEVKTIVDLSKILKNAAKILRSI